MRCLTPLAAVALVVVVALAGYNYWQIGRLKSELAGIKAKVHSGRAAAGNQQDLLTALAAVKRHTSRARQLLGAGQMGGARLELDKSLQNLEEASALSQDIAADAGHGLGAVWLAVRREVQSAWKELSRQGGRRRPQGNGSASDK